MKIIEDYVQRRLDKELEKEKEKREELEEKLEEKDNEIEKRDNEIEKRDNEIEKKYINTIINLNKEGYKNKDIARIACLDIDFVNKTLAQNQ